MDSKKHIIHPKSLTIVTTYQCTAACPNCCFSCTPKRNEELSFDKIKETINEVLTYVYYYNITYTETSFGGELSQIEIGQEDSEQPYFEILLLDDNEKEAYYVSEDYISSEVKIIVNFVKSENPDITEAQELELTNFLKKNLANLNTKSIIK